MPQSLSKILLHIVFSTKNRAKIILPELESELHAYLAEICRAHNCNAYRVGGTENHIHIACSLPRTITVSKLLEEIKTNSSKWMKSKSSKCSSFAWQSGYGVFSISQSHLQSLVHYIENQHKHHGIKSFEDELLEFFKSYQIEFDEKYVWD
ncbi:MAG: IS200/IS605 family transposase [Fibrobacter sp.]|nr:IS200/IS605 family transposase [Fibrobacter sp.]